MSKIHKPTMRVIDILTSISSSKGGLTFTEISKETEIAKGTLSPILQTLVDNQIISLNEYTMRYNIGSSTFKIGYSFVENMDILDRIKEKMKEVVDSCDEICQMGVLDGKNVLYLEKVEPEQSIKLESSMGKSLPAYATALGKCLLSNYSDEEIKEMYGESLPQITKNTIDKTDDLIRDIKKLKDHGIAYEWGESNEQVMCMAVPINNREKTILSISVSVPIYRAEEEKLREIEELLKNIKKEIESKVDILNISSLS